MPTHTLANFTTEIAAGKFARPYNYDVSWASPGGLKSPTREMLMRCESISFPGQNIETSPDTLKIGPARPHAFSVTYGSVTGVFLCDEQFSERRYFEDWHKLIFNPGDFRVGYFSKYVTEMTITQYKVGARIKGAKEYKEYKTYQVKLFDIFPKNIEALALSTSSSELLRLSVEFEYRNWINLPVNQQPRYKLGMVADAPSSGESQENRGQGGSDGPDAA